MTLIKPWKSDVFGRGGRGNNLLWRGQSFKELLKHTKVAKHNKILLTRIASQTAMSHVQNLWLVSTSHFCSNGENIYDIFYSMKLGVEMGGSFLPWVRIAWLVVGCVTSCKTPALVVKESSSLLNILALSCRSILYSSKVLIVTIHVRKLPLVKESSNRKSFFRLAIRWEPLQILARGLPYLSPDAVLGK